MHTLALVDNKPKILNLKEFISEFLKFRETTVLKRVKGDFKKLRKEHIFCLYSHSGNKDDIKIIKFKK